MLDRPIIFSHADCLDGLVAAWALWTVFGDEADYVFCKYQTDDHLKHDVTNREVYFVDFSAPRQDIINMARKAMGVTIADHHRTAQAALDNSGFCAAPNVKLIFDMNKSGARLAWELSQKMTGVSETPLLVEYVEDRDLWNWKLPRSREVNAYIGATGKTFHDVERLAKQLETDFESAVAAGTAILADHRQRIERNVDRLHKLQDPKGRTVLYGNVTEFPSETGNAALLRFPDVDYTATHVDHYRPEGFSRVFSLRSRKGGVDVSAIAKANGGGGHATAAGFTQFSTVAACIPWDYES